MIRRLRLLLATLFALYSSSVFAVGLGELELKSHLNQRFDGEIVLTNVGALELNEIIANLASQDDFDRVGVARDYHLTDLRFKVEQREDGEFVVHVTSSRPIIEPFLNFIVEAIWPTGRILREYTVLLDPPVFGTGGVERIEPGASGQAAPSARTPGSASPGSQRRKIPPAPSVSSGRTEGVVTQDDEYGMTGPGDTLWTIALKVRPSENVSVQQTMLALQRANPDAFINNNINLLKAGHVLRIPDMSEIRAESTEEAIAEVRVQNEEFEDYRAGEVTQLDARRTPRRDERSEEASDDGELRLLASDRTAGERSGADDAQVSELENELAVAREDLDRARRANSEMNVRLDDLEGQIETLNEIVKLKDDQLAALRAELNRQQSAALDQPTTPAVTTQTSTSGSLLSNPMVLGGVGVLLIGLVAGGLIMMRRRGQSEDDDADDFPDVLMDEEPSISLADEEPAEDAGESGDTEEDEEVTQQTSDVIGEAEIYIAYGRFPQAISFLQNAIENEPDRSDIQLKLLEVYVQTEDATAFNLQLDQLKLLGDEEATAKAVELQSQIPGAAEESAAAMDATVISSEPIAAVPEPAEDDDDDDLSFDLDDLDAETDDDDLGLASGDDSGGDELSLDEAMELGDADLDLDLDAALEEVAEPEADDDAIDLDLDEEIDLDFDDETSEELASTQQLDSDELDLSLGEDDEDLDLDLSLDGEDDADLDLSSGEESGDDELDLSFDDDEGDDLDLGGDDELDLSLDEESADDDIELDLGGDDDEIELDLDGDDDIDLDLSLDEESDGDDLDLSVDGEGSDDGAIELDLDAEDDDALELSLDDEGGDDELDLSFDEEGDGLDLDGDLDDDLDLSLDGDDDLGELNLDEDASSKLDLARAYIEMGDNDGAKSLLEEVIGEGDEQQVSEANELLGKIG